MTPAQLARRRLGQTSVKVTELSSRVRHSATLRGRRRPNTGGDYRLTVGRRHPYGRHLTSMHLRRFEFSADGVWQSIASTLERLGLAGVDIAVVYDPDPMASKVSAPGADRGLPVVWRL
jgi:aryl-alcohol dehydrogenase-like predicted oxidoreductase